MVTNCQLVLRKPFNGYKLPVSLKEAVLWLQTNCRLVLRKPFNGYKLPVSLKEAV